MPRIVRFLTVVFLLLAAPLGAHAKEETVWSFLDGNVPGQWEVKGLDPVPSPTPDGLLIQTNELGRLKRTLQLTHPIGWIEIEYLSAAPTEALLISQSPDGPYTELPFLFEMAVEPKTVYLDVSTYANWNHSTPEIGLTFPAGAQVLIRSITFSSFSLPEKMLTAVRSLWQFDVYTPYTINFLWGPRIAMDTAELALMYEHSPPRIASVNWVLYAILVVAGIALLFRVLIGKTTKRKALLLMATLIGPLWLAYDLRMGTEVLTYAIHPVRGGFNAFSELIQPYLQDEKEYVFLPSTEEYVDSLRYNTYPALPVKPEQAGAAVHYWVVFQRPDILMDEEGRLTMGGEVLTPPGAVVDILDNDSFLFRITQ